MNLLINYFPSSSEERNKELLYCRDTNMARGLFERTIVLEKEKLTFLEIFKKCNDLFPNEICIIANGDIVFDESIDLLKEIDFKNVFIALTRWEQHEDTWKPLNLATSQDVWAFKTPIKVTEEQDIRLAQPGCENRLARVLYDLGYEIRNPSLKIQTKHFHKDTSRTPKERIKGPYLCLMPNDDVTKKADYILVDSL